jgi:hypothetical protein
MDHTVGWGMRLDNQKKVREKMEKSRDGTEE